MAPARVPARRLVALLTDQPRGRPAYRWLATGIRGLLIDGRLAHDSRLPSERELSGALGVSRTTVTRAYGELAAGGWASARRGSGTTLVVRGQDTAAGGALVPADAEDGPLDLAIAAPPAPPGTMAAIERAVGEVASRLGGHGYRVTGEPALRECIAERYRARGLPTDPDQIVITPGALAATSVLARTLIGPGDRAVMETPSYPNSIATLRANGARVIGLPIDTNGWDVSSFEAVLRQTAPRLALLIPDFQNPTGALMDARTRERVAAVLARTRTTGAADETMVDLWLDVEPGEMPPPLAYWNRDIVTIGGTSKAFWGGVRIGWLRVPDALRDRIMRARASLDLGSSMIDQLVGYELLSKPEQLLDERRAALRESRAALVDALREHLPEWEYVLPHGGVALWVRMPEPVSSALVLAAERHGVRLASGGQFGVDQPLRNYLRLPYTLPADVVREAIERLALAYAEVGEDARPVGADPAAFVA